MSRLLSQLNLWLSDLINLLFPATCANCGCRLIRGEQHICTSCYVSLPFTRLSGCPGNSLEQMFWGQFTVARAHAWLKYQAGADSTGLITKLKYGRRPQIGFYIGKVMATELLSTDFFQGIDGIIAVPLHESRQKKRGYNQSDEIAKGISTVTHIPILENVVERSVPNPTQTRLHREERIRSVANIFSLRAPQRIAGKHILLVDDVVTTGATIISCAKELSKAENVTISVMTAYTVGGVIDLHPRRERN